MLRKIRNWIVKHRAKKIIDADCEQHTIITRIHPKYCRQLDIVTDGQLSIPVKDVTHYLVQEFETQDRLKGQVKMYEDMLQEEREKTNKYNASLVLIDEYKKRIDNLEEECSEYEEKLRKEKDAHNKTISELEVYKVERVKKLEDFNETKRIAKEEFIQEAISRIKAHKGNISKEKAIALVTNTLERNQNEKKKY